MKALLGMILLCALAGAQTPLGKPMDPREDDGSMAKADAALALNPDDAEKTLAAGLARDRAWRYAESIQIYTRGMKLAPADWRFPRYRGHRYLSTRQFDRAVDDLERARKLAPQSFDVAYHLGLAYYLKGQFDKAAAEYGRCLAQTGQGSGAPLAGGGRLCAELKDDADSRIAVIEWRYRALRRAKKDEEAEKLLETVGEDWQPKENEAYYESLLFYKGMRTEKSLLDPSRMKDNRFVTVAYAVANYHLTEGNARKACPLLRKIVDDPAWNGFGYIAAETELVRGACKDE
jgi:tetratricopeptide (TPR) repeat protein